MSSYKTVVNIDSLYRENYDGSTSSNFNIWLPKQLNNVTSMRLMTAEIPNTIYLFSSKSTCIGISNNTFRINIRNKDSGDECIIKIVIPDGIWYSREIVKYINDVFTEHYFAAPFNSPDNMVNFLVFDVSRETGKSIFRFKNTFEFQENASIKNNFASNTSGYDYNTDYSDLSNIEYKLLHPEPLYFLDKFNDLLYNSREKAIEPSASHELLSNTALYILGFKTLSEIENYVTFDDKGPLGSFNDYSMKFDTSVVNLSQYMDSNAKNNYSDGYIQSSSVYGESRTSYFYISINDYVNNDKNQVVSCKTNGMISSDIIAKVQIKNSPFNSIIDNNQDMSLKTRQYYGPSNIKKLSIMLIDKFGKVLDLNNSEMSLSLEFTIAE